MINPDSNAEQLVDIAVSAVQTAKMYNISTCVAMLSYSTGESGKGESVDKVRQAIVIARRAHPELKIEGPMQYDAAVDAGVARANYLIVKWQDGLMYLFFLTSIQVIIPIKL